MKKSVLLNATLVLATAFVFMALPACKKNDVTPSPTKTELISKANWKIVAIEQKNAAGAWVDITSTLEACELDNILIFRSNLSYETNEGATVCDAGDPQVNEAGTWKFESNETQVSFTETGGTIPNVVDIVKLTGDTLVFVKSFSEAGTNYNYQVSFSH
jgi:hypothetical protein